MKKFLFLTLLLTVSCVQDTYHIATETPLLILYPPCHSKNSIMTTDITSIPINMLQDLPYGLTLIKFQSLSDSRLRDLQDQGCAYASRDMYNTKEINLGNSIQVLTYRTSNSQEIITVQKNKNKEFEITLPPAFPGLLEAWSYESHWIIEVMTDNGIDIIRDGESLKEINNYKKVFSFQILGNKPFYFYQNQNNVFGVNYGGVEIQLDYDDVPYTNFTPGADQTIVHYRNMIVFSAKKSGVDLEIVMGIFDKP